MKKIYEIHNRIGFEELVEGKCIIMNVTSGLQIKGNDKGENERKI